MNLDSASQIATSVFADSYAEARTKFRARASTALAYACSARGPNGEDLFTDVAYLGRHDAKNLLVLVSATHGPEGYCGSASQLALFEGGLAEKLPASAGVLLVHALNCYGFTWDRRVTAEGCDLNRNFIDFGQPLPTNAGYEELLQHFVPEDVSPDGIRRAEAGIAQYIATHGDHAFRVARASGQYNRPEGMFYGGSGPTEARRTLEKIAADHDVASREKVIIIDYHTGLGPYGYGELQCEQSSGTSGHERATAIFGPSATSPDLGTSSSVALHGTQDEFWQRLLGERHTYVALEYGTYSAASARDAGRMDHWLFKYRRDEADGELGRKIRETTKRHFYPQRADWKEMVVSRSHLVHRQALAALA